MRVTARGLGWNAGSVPVLRGVDVDIAPGTITGVVGPNGSGKTTLLHLLAGLRRPSAGTIEYDGRDARRMSARARARLLALVEQHPDTGLELTVAQVVALGRIPHVGRWPGARDDGAARVGQAMDLTGVTDLADRTWSTLSGGERQRTHLARALAQQPELLLLDEPTNHLDLRHQIELLNTVSDLGLTTIAVLHDLDLAAAFCPRLIVMSRGSLVAEGRTPDVLTPETIASVFGVVAGVAQTDRLRVSWSATTGEVR